MMHTHTWYEMKRNYDYGNGCWWHRGVRVHRVQGQVVGLGTARQIGMPSPNRAYVLLRPK